MSALLFASEAGEGAHQTFPILAAIILVPVAGAALIALMPRSRPDLARLAALASSIVTGTMSVFMLTQFVPGEHGYQFQGPGSTKRMAVHRFG